MVNSSQTQEYMSDVRAHVFYATMRIKTHLRNAPSTQSQESQSKNRVSSQKHQLVFQIHLDIIKLKSILSLSDYFYLYIQPE